MATIDQLLDAARSEDPQRRQQAALQLGTHPGGTERVAEVVALMVAEPDDFVRESLIWAVVARGRAGVPALLDALADPHHDRERILHTLSKIADPSTVEAIIPFASAGDTVVGPKAWWALACIGTPACLPPLLPHLGDADPDRRRALTRALTQFGAGAAAGVAERLGDADAGVRTHAIEVLLRLADPETYGRTDHRAGGRAEHREQAYAALRDTEAPEAEETLRFWSADEDHPSLAQVAETLLAERA